MSWFQRLLSRDAAPVSRRGLFAGAAAAAGLLLADPADARPATQADGARSAIPINPFVGTIGMFAGDFAPRGWAFCDGQLLQVSGYSTLFSILGTTYGGDGRTTFRLPDLRGRLPIHPSHGPNRTPPVLGDKGGTEGEPSHSHTLPGVAVRGEGTQAVGVTTGGDRGTAQTSETGSGSNLHPYLALSFIIALQGQYPSR